MEAVNITKLMCYSGVKFGTSGARGLVEHMTDRVCFAYTLAFLNHLEDTGLITQGMKVAVAGDYRPSSPRIMKAVGLAIEKAGFKPVNCGFVPTPAVAAYAIKRGIPCIMVTGSHIPDDRNGIKFYKPQGEILKDDEQGMCSRRVDIEAGLFDEQGQMLVDFAWTEETHEAYKEFVRRYISFFPHGCLKDKRIGVYEHSSVARDVLKDVMQGLGAEVIALGYSDKFIPVDTEAVRDEDVQLAKSWAAEHKLDCIVSADGDGDRPLVSDENGIWLRGDVIGIITAHYLGAEHVVTPVSCNSAVEKSGYFKSVRRTRIGSPFVIEVMNEWIDKGSQNIVGYEANGGFLTATSIEQNDKILTALPTRDAVVVPLALLMASIQAEQSISELMLTLPQRFTASGRLKDFPTELSQQKLKGLQQDMGWLSNAFGEVKNVNETDGFRITFVSEEVVHLRPSGNAPELRCYVEADSESRAEDMLALCLSGLEAWK
ncbi:phosphomannomutase [Ghiorsea bivora]|uniref:phosphomannomutase n=1 Tax=Ghiorsea bivora TaxID=1485545 RepID=UPI0037BF28AC